MMMSEEGDTHILPLSASMERPWCGTGAQSSTSAKQQRCRTLREQNILQVLQEHTERGRADEELERSEKLRETGALRFTEAPSPNSTEVTEIRGGLTFPQQSLSRTGRERKTKARNSLLKVSSQR